ncbi:FAD-dependent monooxygenase [Saccharopolyspora sp. K220]|uniref:FAD-dependent monooxygenase n=1 Tax=Saccharopolyspora soli TaxID=2926618 RepID=UPI001F579FB3|nr:FAD-dependent monooxygenase [Saccharopolyspora soli]MCI2422226.1 FAD-dependent monooxygenase [Saccharopolyspora soli]
MKIVCIGAGPAGLYFAISAKLREPGHEIRVIEQDPPGATYGWGVGYGEDLLDTLFRNDPDSARRIRSASVLWEEQGIALRGADQAYLGGYGYALNRASLLEILAERAQGLGVDVEYQRSVEDISEFPEADLVVVADGANSKIRQNYVKEFGTEVSQGDNPYIWLGTDRVFDNFTYDFQETRAGWIWFHAYPSSNGISTFVVECQEDTWRGLELDQLDDEGTVHLLERIFTRSLDGGSLISRSRGRPASWQRFTQVYNQTWLHDNVVLIGDAAHTTHFTIGSGTMLAMLDAIMLAQKLFEHGDDLAVALKEFDVQGHAAIGQMQAAARTSMAWFENVDRYLDRNVHEFCYTMGTRHGGQRPWQYQHHLINQNLVARKALRLLATGSRWYRSCRRGEPWR